MYTGRKAIRKTMHVCVELGTLFLLCYQRLGVIRGACNTTVTPYTCADGFEQTPNPKYFTFGLRYRDE